MQTNTFLQIVILALLLFLVGFLIKREADKEPRTVYTYEVGEKSGPVERSPRTQKQDWSVGPQTLDNPDNPPNCPKCRARMVLRYRKRDWEPFWGCNRFPRCRETLPWRGETFAEFRRDLYPDEPRKKREMLWEFREAIGAPAQEEEGIEWW